MYFDQLVNEENVRDATVSYNTEDEWRRRGEISRGKKNNHKKRCTGHSRKLKWINRQESKEYLEE